ncbi:PIG-L family deacetylase [Sulfolobales archaeon HS-7]|nr:PIG-L family deacetylase [Sulfolobales archaeon HS-7]
MRLLFVAPHPDDECDNAGGTLLRLSRRGVEIAVLYLTDGRKGSPCSWERGKRLAEIRRAEAVAGLKWAGIKRWFFLSYSDGELIKNVNVAFFQVKRVITEFSPHVIIYPSEFDSHPDHRAGGLIVKKIDYPSLLLSYVNWGGAKEIAEVLLVPVSDLIQEKLKFGRFHKSQFKYFDGDYIRKFFLAENERFFIKKKVNLPEFLKLTHGKIIG